MGKSSGPPASECKADAFLFPKYDSPLLENLPVVSPQLRSEILFSGSGWSLRRKLEVAPFKKDEQKGGVL